ncbi:membrane protein [Peptococcaceae bacterium SCADC1_2_3]|nr:membrane protein [Peptococcaceae bacterium SCADC1_2_3]
MLRHQINELALNMEKMKLAEYVNLLEKPRRLLYINFIAGVARGLGIAVGFAILGAVIIYVLQRIVALNLPVIGKFIAEIVTIVQTNLAR